MNIRHFQSSLFTVAAHRTPSSASDYPSSASDYFHNSPTIPVCSNHIHGKTLQPASFNRLGGGVGCQHERHGVAGHLGILQHHGLLANVLHEFLRIGANSSP